MQGWVYHAAAILSEHQQDDHVKEFRLEQKLAASRYITTEMLLADLRRPVVEG